MKPIRTVTLLAVLLMLGGCGTADQPSADNGAAGRDDWTAVTTIEGREIIAQLKQTAKDTHKRDQAVEDQLASTDYQEGFFGEPSKGLEADTAVQAVEGPAAITVVEKVYGREEFDREGVLFFANQTQGAGNSGIWIGLKTPDERLQEVLDILQSRVDAGEILAEPIYFFRSPHTQHELHVHQDQVAKAVDVLHQGRGSYSVSVDTITGEVIIDHDFLTQKEQDDLKSEFPGRSLKFQQQGSMAPAEGESAIIHPADPVSKTPIREGGFILNAEEKTLFVAGGTEAPAKYTFDEADQLPAGRRVIVEATGGLAESDPAQGTAKVVELLPDYHPEGAVLAESDVIEMAIESTDERYLNVTEIRFEAGKQIWIVREASGNEMRFKDRK